MDTANAVRRCFSSIEGRQDIWKATMYLEPKKVVRVTQKRIKGKILKPYMGSFILHVGRPNYQERKIIKTLLAAGEPFPVKRVLLKYVPQRRG